MTKLAADCGQESSMAWPTVEPVVSVNSWMVVSRKERSSLPSTRSRSTMAVLQRDANTPSLDKLVTTP